MRIIDKTDSLLFGGYFKEVDIIQLQDKERIHSLNNNWKIIHFEFSFTTFGYLSNCEYSYRLKGFDETWSLWNKRIAQLMNISVRGVEISRYRLRKKLQIPSDASLFDHLIKIQTKT